MQAKLIPILTIATWALPALYLLFGPIARLLNQESARKNRLDAQSASLENIESITNSIEERV